MPKARSTAEWGGGGGGMGQRDGEVQHNGVKAAELNSSRVERESINTASRDRVRSKSQKWELGTWSEDKE